MPILFSNEIIHAVNHELETAKESVRIITAYCKLSAFEQLCHHISDSVKDKRLMLRFRLDDVIKGSTDFAIIEKSMQEGWKVFIRFDLHAKTYVVDDKRGIVGSANATNSGLSLNSSGNYEMATLVDVDQQDLEKIAQLFRDAIPVDENILNSLKMQFEAIDMQSEGKKQTWSKEITNLFSPHVDTLFSYELPDKNSYCTGEYVNFIEESCPANLNEMQEKIRWSNVYIWLLDTLKKNDDCLYFGALTEKLHNALVTDPKPYRKDVKVLLANLLAVIEQFKMPEVVIDRPNYSQRIMLAERI